MKYVIAITLALIIAVPASAAIIYEDLQGATELPYGCPTNAVIIDGKGRTEISVTDAHGLLVWSYSGNAKIEGLTPSAGAYYGTGTVTLSGKGRIVIVGGAGSLSLSGNYSYAPISTPTLCD